MQKIWDKKTMNLINYLQTNINELNELSDEQKIKLAIEIQKLQSKNEKEKNLNINNSIKHTIIKRNTTSSTGQEMFDLFVKEGVIPAVNALISGSLVTMTLFPFFVITDEVSLFLLKNAFEELQNNNLHAIEIFLKKNKAILKGLFLMGAFFDFAQSNLSYKQRTSREIKQEKYLLTEIWKICKNNQKNNVELFEDTILKDSMVAKKIFKDMEQLQIETGLDDSQMEERLIVVSQFNNKYNLMLNKKDKNFSSLLKLNKITSVELNIINISIIETLNHITTEINNGENPSTLDSLKPIFHLMLTHNWTFWTYLNNVKTILNQEKDEEWLVIKLEDLMHISNEQISIIYEIIEKEILKEKLDTKMNQLKDLVYSQEQLLSFVSTFITFAYDISTNSIERENITTSPSFDNEHYLSKIESIQLIKKGHDRFLIILNDMEAELKDNEENENSKEIKKRKNLINLNLCKKEILTIHDNLIILKTEFQKENNSSSLIEKIQEATIILYEQISPINTIIAANNMTNDDLKIKFNEIKNLVYKHGELLTTIFSYINLNYNLTSNNHEDEHKSFLEKNAYKSLLYFFLASNKEIWEKENVSIKSLNPLDKTKKVKTSFQTNVNLFKLLLKGVSENNYNNSNWINTYEKSLNSQSLETLTAEFKMFEENRILTTIEPTTNSHFLYSEPLMLNPQPLITDNSHSTVSTNWWNIGAIVLGATIVSGSLIKFFYTAQNKKNSKSLKSTNQKETKIFISKDSPDLLITPYHSEEIQTKEAQSNHKQEENEHAPFISV